MVPCSFFSAVLQIRLFCQDQDFHFLSRPRPRPKPRLFSQDQGKTFYFEINTKSKTFCRSSELAAIWNITSTNAVIS